MKFLERWDVVQETIDFVAIDQHPRVFVLLIFLFTMAITA